MKKHWVLLMQIGVIIGLGALYKGIDAILIQPHKLTYTYNFGLIILAKSFYWIIVGALLTQILTPVKKQIKLNLTPLMIFLGAIALIGMIIWQYGVIMPVVGDIENWIQIILLFAGANLSLAIFQPVE